MKSSNKTLTIFLSIFMIVLILGISYAFFTYSRASDRNSQLITGEVYMHYNDGIDTINLEKVFPEKDEVARSKTNNTITFTIDGKNTTTNKDIYYEFDLIYGEEISGKTRLKDENLKFDLIETINNVSTTVLEGVSYDEINNTRIWVNTINKNTTSEVVITYQLRMWISSDTTISDTDLDADYTTSVYKNSYANVKVKVYGDFNKKTLYPLLYQGVETTLNSNLLESDGESKFLSGSAIDGNYVSYSGYLWRVVSLNDNGTVKLVTDETFGSYGYTYTNYSILIEYLNNDFLDTLNNYDKLLVTDYKWDTSIIEATTKSEITRHELKSFITAPVGLLNLYEYAQSEKVTTTSQLSNNKKYQAQFIASNHFLISNFNTYLNNGTSWFLISRGNGNLWAITDDYAESCADSTGKIASAGLRPSIVLKSGVMYSKGDGSKENPYILFIK